MAQYIVYCLDGDPELPALSVTPNATDMGPMVLSVVGAGNPFYAFQSLPMPILVADEIGVDFNGAPLASLDHQTNRVAVAGMYATPPATGEANDGTNKVWVVA